MLSYLHLKNFRAFKDQRFNFKKLNLFIGKNNSGKSSAISAINVVAQTVLHQDFGSVPLILNNVFDELGTYIDVVNGNVSTRKMSIEIGFDNYSSFTEFKYRSQRREIEVTHYQLRKDGKPVYSYKARKDAFDVEIFGTKFEALFPNQKKRRPNFRNSIASIPYTVREARNRKELTKSDQLYRRAASDLIDARFRLLDHFHAFDSISPFREKPSRTYLHSGESAKRIGTTGTNTAAILAADSSKRGAQKKELEKKVSDWFRYTGIAEKLEIETLTPRHFEVCLISNDGSKHNICDVGFGCSQVLPVLVSGLNLFANAEDEENGILVVQEPEIHLHPDAQAAMGSFFANLSQLGQVFIETHSDNLVLRVARHVAMQDIEASDVAIFFVADDGEKRVTDISISETGAFEPEWPNGFFPQRQAESLMLARAAMRATSQPKQKNFDFSYPPASA
ncbi:AAA family ATPase [Sphingomicrobium marinum]|uniref:AAA family ATPase n=1 Tax=Sphingomicrobium marinum TaxID=1227950 RepID=UPI00223F89E9|nr:AAA family ATPase [Sphingomicrobium marinum]